MQASSDNAVPGSSRTKQRRLRKGTFSCRECKTRKIRCEFRPASSTSCTSCRRRGLRCVGQEFEDPQDRAYEDVGDRTEHVEALVSQLVQQRAGQTLQRHAAPLLRDATREDTLQAIINARQFPPSLLVPSQSTLNNSCSLSSYLRSILPPPPTARLILGHGKFYTLPSQIGRASRKMLSPLSAGDERLAHLSEIPSPAAHPVIFARRLIQLALCLHQLDAPMSDQLKLRLNEPVHDVASRYIDIVSRHITSQDLLVDSPEGLEILMLESIYHISLGNNRAAWLTCRRALNLAQMMGFPGQIERNTQGIEPLWFRLIYGDRFVSMMLGLPPATDDETFSSNEIMETSNSSHKLERMHVMIAGRIIARNLRMQRNRRNMSPADDGYDGFQETQNIDDELKKAARYLPANWWSIPALHDTSESREAMEITARIVIQMHQYYLIVLLHQPFFIRDSSSQKLTINNLSSDRTNHTYSKLAVISASREVLSRFLVVRKSHPFLTYRGMDDKASVAILMLLLAHIDGHRDGRENVLEHQRLHDLGIVLHSIEEMQDITPPSPDIATASVRLLRKLVELEEDAANGTIYLIQCEGSGAEKELNKLRMEENALVFTLPYFGIIRITPQKTLRMTAWDNSTSFTVSGFQTEISESSAPTELCASNAFHSVLPHYMNPISSSFDFDNDFTRLSSDTDELIDNPEKEAGILKSTIVGQTQDVWQQAADGNIHDAMADFEGGPDIAFAEQEACSD